MAIILLTYALLLLMLAIQLQSDLKNSAFMQCCLKRSMAQSKLINKGCYISNTSKRKILSALTEDCSMTGIASIDRFHMVQMLTRSFNIFRVQIMKQFNKSSREYKLLKVSLDALSHEA